MDNYLGEYALARLVAEIEKTQIGFALIETAIAHAERLSRNFPDVADDLALQCAQLQHALRLLRNIGPDVAGEQNIAH